MDRSEPVLSNSESAGITKYCQKDKLGFKHSCQVLADLIQNPKNTFPLSIAVCAPWGTGKTFFLNMLREKIDECNNPDRKSKVLFLNAWKLDLESDPLPALAWKIFSELDPGFSVGDLTKALGVSVLSAADILQKRYSRVGIFDSCSQIRSRAKGVTRHSKLRDISLDGTEFRDELKRFIRRNFKNGKLFVLVDELDRCKPDWAVLFLERVKHLFDLEELVFVFGVDISQLEASIRGCFGPDYDSALYLQRFFDYQIQLIPRPGFGFFLDEISGVPGDDASALLLHGLMRSSAISTRQALKLAKNVKLYSLLQLPRVESASLALALFLAELTPVFWESAEIDIKEKVLFGSIKNQMLSEQLASYPLHETQRLMAVRKAIELLVEHTSGADELTILGRLLKNLVSSFHVNKRPSFIPERDWSKMYPREGTSRNVHLELMECVRHFRSLVGLVFGEGKQEASRAEERGTGKVGTGPSRREQTT